MNFINKTAENSSYNPALAMAALGIVFGDIGTSPLYAIRETLGGLAINQSNVLGVLSLIFWSLVIIITLKYLALVFKADNEGEGGTLALLALLKQKKPSYEPIFYVLAIFGAGLLLGDGMLTPAISVVGALEGLETLSPSFEGYVVPLSCVILIFLFAMQSRGTAKIGRTFGPMILIWFVTIAALGLWQIQHHPQVFAAINPYYAYLFFANNGYQGYLLLGGVFLVVTGGEALYADIGHFGKSAIRASWLTVALPCLILNYFGQGAYLLEHPEGISNPFYMLAPEGFFIPLLIIATLATIIASQAVITATFSLTRQAVLLGLYPKLPIIQTSQEFKGQIYIPQINFFLMVGTLLLILAFQSASGLTHAYGIAVNLVMLLVTLMVTYAAYVVWEWSKLKIFAIFTWFLVIDFLFLGANIHKFLTGGWAPVLFALVVSFLMYTWKAGQNYLKDHFYVAQDDTYKLLKQLHYKALTKLEGITTIFISDVYDPTGGGVLNLLKLMMTVPQHILIVNYVVDNIPYVDYNHRFEIRNLDENVCQLTLHYGFMDSISIPKALFDANDRNLLPFPVNVDKTTYLVEVPHIIASKSKKSLWFFWQEKIFAFLMRNYSANINIEFYQLPYNRTVAVGSYFIV